MTTAMLARMMTVNMAVVMPTFTSSAYSQPGFYDFYTVYAHTPGNVTANLNRLNVTVSDNWGVNSPLATFLQSNQARVCGISQGRNLSILKDQDITLHPETLSKFRVIIIGFEEYVSSPEYYAFKNFVAMGGTFIIVGSSTFLAQVEYSRSSNHVYLVRGHGWAFNGKSAWKYALYEFWHTETANWVGSNYCCFEPARLDKTAVYAVANTTHPLSVALRSQFGVKIRTEYTPHEESVLTNATDSVITYLVGDFLRKQGGTVASYEHRYRAGRVIDFSGMYSDVIGKDRFAQYLLIESVLYSDEQQNLKSQSAPVTTSATLARGVETHLAPSIAIVTILVALIITAGARKPTGWQRQLNLIGLASEC